MTLETLKKFKEYYEKTGNDYQLEKVKANLKAYGEDVEAKKEDVEDGETRIPSGTNKRKSSSKADNKKER